MKGIILAAGDGGRLRPLTVDTPKVLLEIGRRPLIHYPLKALHSAGISEIAVVAGYQAEKIQDALGKAFPDLTFLYNADYDGGNALSVYTARSFVAGEPFVVCMGDHVIGPEMVSRLLCDDRDGCTLCVDHTVWHPAEINDATRVKLMDSTGNIDAIGKHLRVWDAIDTGVFKMTEDVFPAVEYLMDRQGVEVGITDLVGFMGGNGQPFSTCDVSGIFWADVDTPEDYLSIGNLLREKHGERV